MSLEPEYRLEVVYPASSLARYFSGSPTIDVSGLHDIGFIHTGRAFASTALKLEVEALREAGGLPKDAVYHCTSSKALPRIAAQQAILSSREVLDIYGAVETGEAGQHQANGYHGRALDDVYAHNAVSTSYFFGTGSEYPVVFGIEKTQVSHSFGEECMLGSRVPLDAVVSLTVPPEQLAPTKDWVAENCKPSTLTVSLHAASLLSTLR